MNLTLCWAWCWDDLPPGSSSPADATIMSSATNITRGCHIAANWITNVMCHENWNKQEIYLSGLKLRLILRLSKQTNTRSVGATKIGRKYTDLEVGLARRQISSCALWSKLNWQDRPGPLCAYRDHPVASNLGFAAVGQLGRTWGSSVVLRVSPPPFLLNVILFTPL